MGSIWCVAANVRPELYGRATALGTKHFAAGTCVWILSGYFRESMDDVRVLGQHRVTSRWIAIAENPRKLANFRAEAVHQPELSDKLRGFLPEGRWFDRMHCEDKAAILDGCFPPIEDLPAEVAKWTRALDLFAIDKTGRPLARQAASALARRPTETPFEVYVLADFLDKVGAPLSVAEIVRTLA